MREPRIKNKRISLCFALVFALFTVLYLGIARGGTIDTSGVTVQTVIDRVRYDINETTAGFWSDTELQQWINEAIWEINSKTRCLETAVSTQALAEDDYDYAIAGNWLSIETIIHDSGTTTGDSDTADAGRRLHTLKRIDIKNFGHTRETGRPKQYTIWNDILYVWPIPDSTVSGTTLILFVVTLPTSITSATSAIETPAYFDHCILNYVKAKAYFKDKREAKGNYYMALFEKAVREYVVTILKRNIPDP